MIQWEGKMERFKQPSFKKKQAISKEVIVVCCLKSKFRRETATLIDDKVMINCLCWEFYD